MKRKIENASVVITGGAGFIGSNLVECLLNQGNRVICLDDFSTGKEENIAGFKDHPKFELIRGDIRDLGICRAACDGVDFVLHHAAIGSVPWSVEDPIYSNGVNVSGFLNVVVAARDQGVKRIVYASSSANYGDNEDMPKVEGKIGRPLSPYAVTKYVNELYADVFARTYGVELVGLRYFNVFGPRQDPAGAYAAVIPKFVIELLNHRSPVIHGDGSFSRDFVYVENVIQANQLAALTQNPSAVNQVYNVACGECVNLKQMVEVLKKYLSGFDPEVANISAVHGPNRLGDIPHSMADISKARELLGFAPKHSFEDGVKQVAEWYFRNWRE